MLKKKIHGDKKTLRLLDRKRFVFVIEDVPSQSYDFKKPDEVRHHFLVKAFHQEVLCVKC